MKDEKEFATANTTTESSGMEKIKMSPDMVTQEYLHKARINKQGIERYRKKIRFLESKNTYGEKERMINLNKKILTQFEAEYTEQMQIISEWLNDDSVNVKMSDKIYDNVEGYVSDKAYDKDFAKRIREFFDKLHGREPRNSDS